MRRKRKKQPYRVVCLGNVLVDILVKPIQVFPPAGGLLPVDDIEMTLGGCASNTAVALSRLGVPVSLWGKVGRDFFSGFVMKQLKRSGVETSGMHLDPDVETSATVVLISRKGQRSFLHSVAANDHIYMKELNLSRLSGFQHLHIGGYFLFQALDGKPMAYILEQAQKHGLTTSMDTAWDLKGRWMKALKPCLPFLDYFMPSEKEVQMLLGYAQPARAAQALIRFGVKTVILKLGEKGSYLLSRNGLELYLSAFPSQVKDTTGAGDCFCAGFIKGLALGWDLKKCLQLGNAAGACAVEALGATNGIHSFKQISKFL